MASLSIVFIVNNEEEALKNVLPDLGWCDEIIIVDSNSTDATLDVAKKYTDKIFQYPDWQGFGIQRQRAQSHATGDWILMVDADERVTSELSKEVQAIVASNDQTRLYAVPRLSWVFGRFIRHSGWYPDYVIRLYPRARAGYGADNVHEKVVYPDDMKLLHLKGDLLHYTYRDMEHYLTKSAQYAAAWAEQRMQRGKRSSLTQAVLHGLGCFIKMYVIRLGVLDGRQGLLLALLSAHSTFAKYADLWVKQNGDVSK